MDDKEIPDGLTVEECLCLLSNKLENQSMGVEEIRGVIVVYADNQSKVGFTTYGYIDNQTYLRMLEMAIEELKRRRGH